MSPPNHLGLRNISIRHNGTYQLYEVKITRKGKRYRRCSVSLKRALQLRKELLRDHHLH